MAWVVRMSARRVSSGALGAVAGATAGVAAAVVTMTGFFPLARLFDPTAGGDPRSSLAAELALGFVGGVVVSPAAGGIGALVGWRLRLRRLRPKHHLALAGLVVALGVAVFAALNGGLLDSPDRSTDSLRFVVVLSTLGCLVGFVMYAAARRMLLRTRPVGSTLSTTDTVSTS